VIYHISLLTLGDNLISLSLLSRLRERGGITIVGTALTRRIAAFFPALDIPIAVDFDRVPAFLDLRRRGVIAAALDANKFRRSMAERVTSGDSLILENNDLRGLALARFRGVTRLAPSRTTNIYEDRRALLQRVFQQTIPLEQGAPLPRQARRVTINPSAGRRVKAVPPRTLAALVSYLKSRQIEVQLIDHDRAHGALTGQVDGYHVDTTLESAVALVRESDLYIGADSLMAHLAYFCATPAIVLFNETNLYFAPPGVAEQGAYVEFVARKSDDEFRASLDALFARAAVGLLHVHPLE